MADPQQPKNYKQLRAFFDSHRILVRLQQKDLINDPFHIALTFPTNNAMWIRCQDRQSGYERFSHPVTPPHPLTAFTSSTFARVHRRLQETQEKNQRPTIAKKNKTPKETGKLKLHGSSSLGETGCLYEESKALRSYILCSWPIAAIPLQGLRYGFLVSEFVSTQLIWGTIDKCVRLQPAKQKGGSWDHLGDSSPITWCFARPCKSPGRFVSKNSVNPWYGPKYKVNMISHEFWCKKK